MTRFLVGFAAGAFVLALIQYQFAPIPTPASIARHSDTQRRDSSEPELNVVQGDPQRERNRDGNRQLSEKPYGAATSAADDEAREPDSEHSESENTRPENPIDLPDTHAGFVEKSTPSLPEEHTKVEDEEVDPSWAEHVEALIYSFISSQPNGTRIQIVSLVCRTTRCEIVGSVFGEQGGDIWNTVLTDMRQQPWFSSNFANSMFGTGGAYPGEYRFVTILARVGSEIVAPVPQ